MTTTGENRLIYAQAHPRPSRFTNRGAEYRAWARRADAWNEGK